MSESAARPLRTGALWIVLTLLLMGGTIASAFVVWAVLGIWSTHAVLLYGPIAVGAAVVAILALLLLTGMLYRVDRIRGVPHREVRLFE